MERFQKNDTGYLSWVRHNSDGYVLNVLRTHIPYGLMLHRATCYTIRNEAIRRSGWTTGDYVKVCGPERQALRNWAQRHVGKLPADCLKCHP